MIVYSDKALKRIIIENINDKRIVCIASELYCYWSAKREDLECELTSLLMSKEYEGEPNPTPDKPIPRKPVTDTPCGRGK